MNYKNIMMTNEVGRALDDGRLMLGQNLQVGARLPLPHGEEVLVIAREEREEEGVVRAYLDGGGIREYARIKLSFGTIVGNVVPARAPQSV